MNLKAKNIVEQDVKDYVSKQVKGMISETLSRNGVDHRCTKAINQIAEGVNNSTDENGSGYTHYAVSKTTGKIVNGWDYEGYDSSELNQFKKDYFIDDLKDMGFNPKSIKILTLKGLRREGIDPDDDSNWSNGEEDMQESAVKSKIMSIVNEELGRIVKKQLKENSEEENDSVEGIDFYTFVDILDNCGWSYSNFYDVTGKNGETGTRYEINADSGNACPFEELMNKIKSAANNPNKVIASQGHSKSATELKRASIVIID